ncbi:MAG: exodeoxyribonuclease III [Acidobacteriota bacterium]
MRLATWNVNSVRSRLPRLLPWLERQRPDVVCLQETKVVDEDFPRAEIEAAGYRCLVRGQKTYNGVAILSRDEASRLELALPGDPGDEEARFLAATIGQVRVIDVYVPNGGEVGIDRYFFKLSWYRRLRTYLESSCRATDLLVICGDFNVAPEDRDVWDPEKRRGKILFSEPEKEALQNLTAWGLVDTLRLHHQEGGIYTWWDYRVGSFHRGWGLRIDHILASPALAPHCTAVEVDREERKGEKPSDHAPVVATFEL